MSALGVLINDKHTYRDWGLRWHTVKIPLPEPKTYTVDVPGADGEIDLTEALQGYVRYKRREIELGFDGSDRNFEEWAALVGSIANFCHGKKVRIQLDTDQEHYFEGRISIDPEKTVREGSGLVLTAICDPYRYRWGDGANWLWDPFSFIDGDIREHRDIDVIGTKTVVIPATIKPVSPTIICSAEMSVTTEDNTTYYLAPGTNHVPEIIFCGSEKTLVFNGQGVVTLEYQGGVL